MWIAIVSVILLPALSQTGYAFYTTEYLFFAAVSALIGLGIFALTKIRYLEFTLLLSLSVFAAVLYFGSALMHSTVAGVLALVILTGFIYLADRHRKLALRLSGFAALGQIVATAMATPTPAVLDMERDVPRNDVPSVIHIIVDEHAGIGAFPPGSVSTQRLHRLEDSYTSHGFTVFRRAYSADGFTELSIKRLFNPSLAHAKLGYETDQLFHPIRETELLQEIEKERALDLTFSDFVDLRPSLEDMSKVSRLHIYRTFVRTEALNRSGLPFGDRLIVAISAVEGWLIRAIHSPIAITVFTRTKLGQQLHAQLNPSSSVHPFMARSLLHHLADRLSCCGSRGTYVFAHLIYPHHPYVFDETCKAYPPSEWSFPMNFHAEGPDTLASRNAKYRRHLEQALCLASDIGEFVDKLDQNPEFKDAVIIIHGDHGGRVSILDYAKRDVKGYSKAAFERDWRGTFLAVRIPGALRGQAIDKPVRIDDIFRRLVYADFRSLDLQSLEPGADTPYPVPAPE